MSQTTFNKEVEASGQGIEKRTDKLGNLVLRFESAKTRMQEVDEKRQLVTVRKDMIKGYLESLRNQDLMVTESNEKLWFALLEKVTVFGADDIRFTFKDGTTVVS